MADSNIVDGNENGLPSFSPEFKKGSRRSDRLSLFMTDTVHNQIEVPYPWKLVIDTAQFQRLRNIKQLGITTFVYPTSDHSRFSHSIGVAHLAGRLVARLRLDGRGGKDEGAGRIDDKDALCVQLAALCHDLGHGPFSHMYDGAFFQLLKAKGRLVPELHGWKHESASLRMFDRLLKDNSHVERVLREEFDLEDIDFLFIKECILGEPLTGETELRGRDASKAFLYDIVSNKRDGMDVDRFDYLLRDQKATGVSCEFDVATMERLINGISVRKDAESGRLRLCYANKLGSDVLSVFATRFCLHKKVYQHKTIKACEILLTKALLAADDHLNFKGDDGKIYQLRNAVLNMGAFEKLTDSVFDQILCAADFDPKLEKSSDLLRRLQRRQFDKLVATAKGDAIKMRKWLRQRNETVDCGLTERLSSELVQQDVTGRLVKSDVSVVVSTIHYGKADANPLHSVLFYNHKAAGGPDAPPPYHLDDDELQGELANKFDVGMVFVFASHGLETEKHELINSCFNKLLLSGPLTPCKRVSSFEKREQTPEKENGPTAKKPKLNLAVDSPTASR